MGENVVQASKSFRIVYSARSSDPDRSRPGF